MRTSQVGAILAAVAALIAQPVIADPAGPEPGRAPVELLDGVLVVVALGIVGCVVLLGGVLLSALLRRRRRETRYPCSLSVRVEPSLRTPVRLVEISRRGARLRMMLPPLPGAKVTVHWEDLALDATVVWSGEVFAGLRFRNAVPKPAMSRMIAASPPRAGRSAANDWATPGLGV